MDSYSKIFSNDWLWLSNYVFAFVLARAAWTAPWRALWRNTERFTVLVGLSLGLTAFWWFPVGLRDGLSLHLLGATLCFLMFEWQIATLLLSAILLATLYGKQVNLLSIGSSGLMMVVLPVMASRLFFHVFQRYGIKSYFSYTWWNGYVSGMLVMLLVGLANGLLIWAFGSYSWFTLKNEYFVFLPIIASSESVLTGVLISGIAVFLPNAVACFDPETYFTNKK